MNISICDLIAEYPGIVFSKQKKTAKITKDGGEIIGEGIKLAVPPGAVAEGDEGNISLQACLGGPFCLPEENMIFVSPVYLIEPPFAFHKEVTLSISMFMKVETEEDCKKTVFVTSPTKGVMNEEDAQWNFRTYRSPKFSIGSRNGEIQLKHFCFTAFARLGIINIKLIIACVLPVFNLQVIKSVLTASIYTNQDHSSRYSLM